MPQQAIRMTTLPRPQTAHLPETRHDDVEIAEPAQISVRDPANMTAEQLDAMEAALPEKFSCSIARGGVMVDPVYDRRHMKKETVDGKTQKIPMHVYERAAIENWLKDHNNSPLNREPTSTFHLRSYKPLREEIDSNPVAHFIAVRDAAEEGRPTVPQADAQWDTVTYYACTVGHAVYDPAANATNSVVRHAQRTLGPPMSAITDTVSSAYDTAAASRTGRFARALLILSVATSPTWGGILVGVHMAETRSDKVDTIGSATAVGLAVNAALAVALFCAGRCTPRRQRRQRPQAIFHDGMV